MTVDRIRSYIEERLPLAKEESAASHRRAVNSYGAGYDAGVLGTLEELLSFINGELE